MHTQDFKKAERLMMSSPYRNAGQSGVRFITANLINRVTEIVGAYIPIYESTSQETSHDLDSCFDLH